MLTETGEQVTAELTRTHARAEGLAEGLTVWLSPADSVDTMPAPSGGKRVLSTSKAG